MEVPAAETTAILEGVNTHTTPTPRLITVVVTAQTAGTSNDDGAATVSSEQAVSITALIDGTTYTSGGTSDGSAQFTTFPFTTTFTFQSTTLELSYSAVETFFTFEGATSTEVTIASQHTHVTINGVETAVDLPGLTTLIEVSESTSVAVTISDVTTTLVVPEETYELTITADTIHEVDSTKYCAASSVADQSLADGATGSLCIPALSTVITLPTGSPVLYLNAPGVTTALGIPAATTTFVPEQTITIVKDGSTETSVIPAVVSTYTTSISDTNVSSEESSTSMEPTITGPVTITVTEPGTTEPGTTEPGTTNDSTTIPGTTIPGTTEPGTEYTTTEPGSEYLLTVGKLELVVHALWEPHLP